MSIIGYYGITSDTKKLSKQFDESRRLQFEIAFRDNETEKRFFGELESSSNLWAGYYICTDNEHTYKHLVINSEGKFWLYRENYYQDKGKGENPSKDSNQFLAEGVDPITGAVSLTLRKVDQTFLLQFKHTTDTHNLYLQAKDKPFAKSATPRFPILPTENNQVKFIGVFSAKYGVKEKSFWVSQLWLWESHGKIWGRYLRDYYTQGQRYLFIGTEAIEPACQNECKTLSFASSRGAVRLNRISENEITAHQDGDHEEITLTRGATVPGFILDLAPLASKEKNLEWISNITASPFIEWQVPNI